MDDSQIALIPETLAAIEAETIRLGFSMPSERKTGSLLRTLAASKPGGKLLELGTGTGLSTAWILDGMDAQARLISVDNDPVVSGVAKSVFGADERLTLVVEDGIEWLKKPRQDRFDLIFADAMPGKYEGFDDAWRLLAPNGFYVIDDMLPQANWPEGHAPRVARLLEDLEQRSDCHLARMSWASGLVVAVRTVRS